MNLNFAILLILCIGAEVEKYWKWAYEVKPELPNGFLRNFKHSGAIIQKVHIEENIKLRNKQHYHEKKILCMKSICPIM